MEGLGLGHGCRAVLQDVEHIADVTLLHNDVALAQLRKLRLSSLHRCEFNRLALKPMSAEPARRKSAAMHRIASFARRPLFLARRKAAFTKSPMRKALLL